MTANPAYELLADIFSPQTRSKSPFHFLKQQIQNDTIKRVIEVFDYKLERPPKNELEGRARSEQSGSWVAASERPSAVPHGIFLFFGRSDYGYIAAPSSFRLARSASFGSSPNDAAVSEMHPYQTTYFLQPPSWLEHAAWSTGPKCGREF